MKKALLLFGTLCIALLVQSCTTDTDDFAPKKTTYSTSSVTDTVPPPPPNYTTQDNGDLGRDPEKKK